MPIVVVHGVNTRKGPEFDAWTRTITAHCRSHLQKLTVLGGVVRNDVPIFAEWGHEGVRFAWNFASLPKEQRESFGTQESLPEILEVAGVGSLHEIFNQPFNEALSLISEILSTKPTLDQNGALADLLECLYSAHESGTRQSDFEAIRRSESDGELMAAMQRAISGRQSAETFGAAVSLVRDGAGVISEKIAHAISARLVQAGRFQAHRRSAAFIGDLVKYMSTRESNGSSGIQRAVLTTILAAIDQSKDEPLVLVGHSLGGVILFDLLSANAIPAEQIVLVTVGSQVSYFEEMKMLLGSDPRIPCGEETKAPRPKSAARWINAYDPIDVFSFPCADVFSGVMDLQWSSTTSLLKAHGAYFFNPEFYKQVRTSIEAGT